MAVQFLKLEPVPLALLRAICLTGDEQPHAAGDSFVEAFARRHGLDVQSVVTLPNGSIKIVLRSCPFGGESHEDSAIFEYPDGQTGFHCFHGSCSEFQWADLRQKYEPDGGPPAEAGNNYRDDAHWPEPQPLEHDLPPVPKFDLDLLLPPLLRGWVADVAARMQVVADLPAVAMISALAGAVGRRAQIWPKAVDATFIVVAVIWALMIARSGSMKTPTLFSALAPLYQAERAWHEEYQAQMKEYEAQVLKYEAQLATWKQDAKKAAKNGAAPPEPPHKLEPPVARRVIVNHATFEALHLALSQNQYGLLEVRDEVASWLMELDAPTNASIRGLYLQAWTGRGDFVIDRIGRGTIIARDVCLSVAGGITPERLHAYVGSIYSGAAPDDGLLQRFGLAVEPDPPAPFEYVDRAPDANAMEQVSNLFTRLLALRPEKPYPFRFDPAAQELYIDWLTRLENLIRGKQLPSPLAAHMAKYRSLMPALGLLFEIASRANNQGPDLGLDPASNLVSLANARLAATWCDAYLQPHARRMYAKSAACALPARELGRKLLAREVGINGTLNARELYRRQLAGFRDSTTVHAAADVLVKHGWLRAAPRVSGPSGGRPAENWAVSPRLWEEGRSMSKLIPE